MAPGPTIVEPGSSVQETQFTAILNEDEAKSEQDDSTRPNEHTYFTEANAEIPEHSSPGVNGASYGTTDRAATGSVLDMNTDRTVPNATLC